MHFTRDIAKYLFSALFVLIALTLSACNDGSSSSSKKSSIINHPVIADLTVTSTAPANEATDVGINTRVVAVFNKAVRSDTVSTTSFTLQGAGETAIVGPVSYNADTRTATLAPSGNLTDSTVYTATLTKDVADENGNTLVEDFVWTFTTGTMEDDTAPALVSSTPTNGATDVLRNIKLNLVFSEAIDPATVTTSSIVLAVDAIGGADVSGSLSFVNPTTVVLTPDEDLTASTDYILTLGTTIADLAGISLASTTLSFSTGTEISISPATVELGTAGNYVLLAKAGISTTGTTHIVGDIAVSPIETTALTGFDPIMDGSGTFATSALVTGSLFAADMADPTPDTLTTAVSAMETAYVDAAGRSNPDFTELGAGEIGGMTLDAGLYKWGTGVLVTSDVTLNGSATDVWIFQIAEGLKLQDGKSIILEGGALPQNIFWQVAEEVTLNAGTTFNGIILGQTALNMNSGATLNGRALVQTAIALIANDVNEPTE